MTKGRPGVLREKTHRPGVTTPLGADAPTGVPASSLRLRERGFLSLVRRRAWATIENRTGSWISAIGAVA